MRPIRSVGLAVAACCLPLLAASPSVGAAGLSEDIEFGCGLVEQGFQSLGIEVLTARVGQLKGPGQQRRVYAALRTAHHHYANATYAHLTADQAAARRAPHAEAERKYRDLLKKLGGAPAAGSFQGLLDLRNQANALAGRVVTERSKEKKEELIEQMVAAFRQAIDGLGTLEKKAAKALEEHEAKEPDFDKKTAYKTWFAQLQKLRDPRLRIGVEYHRTRYAYSKALPGSRKSERDELLKSITEELDELDSQFDSWAYSIIGQHTLAEAYIDRKMYSEAQEAVEPAVLLIREFVKQDRSGKVKKAMDPWKYKLFAAWAIAAGEQGNFTKAISKIKDIQKADIQVVVGELHLMRARKLDAKKDTAAAKRDWEAAKRVLDRVASVDKAWAARVRALRRKYGIGGGGYFAALRDLEWAVRDRNNAMIIEKAGEVLSYGQAVPADKRTLTFMFLAMALRQERMYYEAYTVYFHIATSGLGGEKAETYASLAVVCMQSQYQLTNDPADKTMFARAKKWLRDKYGGPGKEYGDAMDAIADKRYERALKLLAQVPKTSRYFESALVKTAECCVLWAKTPQRQLDRKTKERQREKDRSRPDQYKIARIQKEIDALDKEIAGLLKRGENALKEFLRRAEQEKKHVHPKILEQRKQLKSSAVYRLGSIYMWDGKERYKDYLAISEGYAKKFPDAIRFHPQVSFRRIRALVALEQPGDAEVELAQLRSLIKNMEDKKAGKRFVDYCSDIIFNAYVASSQSLRKEAEKQAKLAEGMKDKARAKALAELAEDARTRSDQAAEKALEIITAAIDADPDQPYDKLYYVVCEYHRQNRLNEVRLYGDMLLKKVDGDPRLRREKKREVAVIRDLLAIAYFEAKEYRKTYDLMKARYTELTPDYESYERRKARAKAQGRPKPPLPPEYGQYWTAKRYVAKSAKWLAVDSNSHWKEAKELFLELHKRLPDYTPQWWDVTVSIAELRNMRDDHDANLVVIRRFLNTQKELGGLDIRQRYAMVLRDICARNPDGEADPKRKERRKKALELLIGIRGADLEAFQKADRYRDMINTITALRKFRLDGVSYGGRAGKAALRPFAQAVLDGAKDGETKTDARGLIKELQD